MRTTIAFVTSLAALGCLLPATAFAEEAAPAPAADAAAAPAPAPGAEAAPAADASVAAPAPEAPAAEVAAAADAPAPMPGWMRIDSDWGGLQLWGGGTYPITDGVGLAFDMYVTSGFLGELDVGPAITAGPVTITPMIGLQIDWALHRAAALVPQLYVVGSLGPVYTELWLQYYLNKTFAPEAAKDATSNWFYGRLILDYKINDNIAVGPELDLASASEADPSMVSLAIGPNLMLSNVGANSSFMAFIGYETKDSFTDDPTGLTPGAGANHLAGRLTFVHNF